MLAKSVLGVKARLFEYSERDIEWLRECLSPERLKPYLVRARGDDWVALHLYVRNLEVSASLFGVIHILEVGLRNRVHTRMAEAIGQEEWWQTFPLHEKESEDIANARRKVIERGRAATSGQIVAELNMGFWVKLFSKSYEKILWVPHLAQRFPGRLDRRSLHLRLSMVKDIRNRIAHHETLLGRDAGEDYRQIIEAIGWISPTLRRWAEHHTDFPQVLARRIPKPQKPTA